MRDGLLILTEREKEALRLLFRGHDAKSTAQCLGLSVYTVNERLREARRKLSVSSSREAARLLADAEGPNSLGYKPIGVAEGSDERFPVEQMKPRWSVAHRLVWLSGGMLIMSLVIATGIFALVFQGSATPVVATPQTTSPGTHTPAPESLDSARAWLALVDHERWKDSWGAAAALFKSQLSAAKWAATIQPVRQPLGAVSSRTFQSVTKTTSLPGAPAGDYEVIQFQTSFAHRNAAVETIILTRDGAGWKVVGYFIR